MQIQGLSHLSGCAATVLGTNPGAASSTCYLYEMEGQATNMTRSIVSRFGAQGCSGQVELWNPKHATNGSPIPILLEKVALEGAALGDVMRSIL